MKNLFVIFLVTFVFIGCGEKSSGSDSISTPAPTPQPQTEEEERDEQNEDREDQAPTRISIDPTDMNSLPMLKPTTYYIAREENINCKGRYRGQVYNGSEATIIKDVNGNVLAGVCTRFYKVLLMEGTAVLRDRGLGEFTLNYARKVNGTHRFREMDRCVFGEGVQKNLCLIPFHTLAADRKAYKVGDIVYIPAAVDIVLPDGTLHNGFFFVRDTGGAFEGKGFERVDMFVGFQPDHDNVFLNAGFHRGSPKKAYRITGDSSKLIRERFQEKFPDIY